MSEFSLYARRNAIGRGHVETFPTLREAKARQYEIFEESSGRYEVLITRQYRETDGMKLLATALLNYAIRRDDGWLKLTRLTGSVIERELNDPREMGLVKLTANDFYVAGIPARRREK